MHRCSLLLLGFCGCLVQDPAWQGPADTDGRTSGSSETDAEMEGSGSGGTTQHDELPSDCAPLADVPPDAIVVEPADDDELHTIVAEAPAGSTIALAPGTYDRAGRPGIVVSTPGLTLRSATGVPEDVVLAGDPAGGTVLITIAADDVTLAEFTIHGNNVELVEIGVADAVLQRPRLYRMALRDSADAQVQAGRAGGRWTDEGIIACSSFGLTDAFREATTDCSQMGAVFIAGGDRWIVRDNAVDGLWCSTPTYASIAVALGSRDTRVERNLLRNVFRGILFGGDNDSGGRPEPGTPCGVPSGATWGHVRGVIANNVIWVDDARMQGAIPTSDTDLDSMIGFWHVCGGAAVHNTSYVTLETFNGIEWRYPDTAVTIANNSISTTLMRRNGAVALGLDTNAVQTPAEEYVDPGNGDFRLVPGAAARDAGIDVPGVPLPHDFDGNPRVGRPDLGAFEFQP